MFKKTYLCKRKERSWLSEPESADGLAFALRRRLYALGWLAWLQHLPAWAAAKQLSATCGRHHRQAQHNKAEARYLWPHVKRFTGIFWFLTEYPNTSRGMYLQSPSIRTAGASARAAALPLPHFRGRVDAEDSGLDSIALIAAGKKQ